MDTKDLCEHTRIRLIAAAVGHQECTKTESTLIPLPGTKKFIAIGTLPAIAKVLMVEPPVASTAPAPQTFSERDIPADAPRAFAKRYSALLEENMKLQAELEAAKAAPAPQQSESKAWSAGEALLYAGRVVELYDDATMNSDYMIDSKDCAGILTALASMPMFAKAAQAAPSAPTAMDALREMVRWFGKYPEFVPAVDCFDKYKAAIKQAEYCLASKAAPSAKAEPIPGELTDAAIDDVWNAMPGGTDGWLKQFGYRQFARSVARHVLVRVAASMAGAIRPTDDELWEQTIGERDAYHEWADKLANAIATYFGAEIGEHSNMNCPWAEALEVIEGAAPAPAVQAEDVRNQANAEVQLDADRYRWLRDEANNAHFRAPMVFLCDSGDEITWVDSRHGAELDAAVDIAKERQWGKCTPSTSQTSEGESA